MADELMNVIYSFGNMLAGGGIGTTAYHAVSGLNRHGALKKVICLDHEKTEIPESKIEHCVPFGRHLHKYLEGFRYHIYGRFPSDLWVKNMFDTCASRKIEECDFFYSWSGHCLSSLRVARKNGAKTIIGGTSSHPCTQLKILHEEYRKYGIKKNMPEHPEVTKKKNREFKETDYIFAASDFVAESMVNAGLSKEKIIVNPTGCDLKKFRPARKRPETFRVLFVGTVSLRKGVQYLLEAWDKLDLEKAEMTFVGSVSKDTKKIIGGYQNTGNVKFLGDVKNIAPSYRKATIFVFPSLEEGSAKVTYEAMASGLPVVTTFNSGSVVEDGREGFIIPIRDSEAIADKIKYFFDNPKSVEKMGKKARKTAEKYDWKYYGDRIIRNMEKIL